MLEMPVEFEIVCFSRLQNAVYDRACTGIVYGIDQLPVSLPKARGRITHSFNCSLTEVKEDTLLVTKADGSIEEIEYRKSI